MWPDFRAGRCRKSVQTQILVVPLLYMLACKEMGQNMFSISWDGCRLSDTEGQKTFKVVNIEKTEMI